MSLKSIISICLLISVFYVKLCLTQKTAIQIDTFERCKCAKNCILPKFESFLQHYKDTSYIDSVFELTEDINAIKLAILPMKCKVKESLDTCERGHKMNVGDTCAFLNMPQSMWSSFVYSFSPPFKCPFKKGTYIGKNGSLDADLGVFRLDESYFKAEADIYSAAENRYLWTFCIGFSVVTIR